MKAKNNIHAPREIRGLKQLHQHADKPKEKKYPEWPVHPEDVEPDKFPVIEQAYILAYVNAESVYKTARADFERKRAMLLFQLVMVSEVEPGNYEIKLNQDRESFSVTQPCRCCAATGDCNTI